MYDQKYAVKYICYNNLETNVLILRVFSYTNFAKKVNCEEKFCIFIVPKCLAIFKIDTHLANSML